MMRVVSVNVGLPREVQWRGKTVTTSIFKDPVPGPVRVDRLNLEGDKQPDLTAHGGADMAVYAYSSEHYAFWREELPGVPLPWGAFEENLTAKGLLEGTVQIGDRLRIGTAGDSVTVTSRDDGGVTVSDIVGLYHANGGNQGLLRRASELPALPEDWRDRFRKRLRDADA